MPTPMEPSPRWISRSTKFVAASTLFLIFAGAMVTSTGSGLAVPDWPLSYGMVFPPMVGGIFFEHGHRMVAASVGFLTVLQAIFLQYFEPKKFVRILGWTAVGAVIAQGILGGMTVLFFLPPAVSIAHAGLAEIFFCLNLSLAFFTSKMFIQLRAESKWPSIPMLGPSWPNAPMFGPKWPNIPMFGPKWPNIPMFGIAREGRDNGAVGRQADTVASNAGHRNVQPRTSALAQALPIIVFLQILAGALMRHLGAGLAIPDFPLSFGRLIPPLTDNAVLVNFVHRVGAVVVIAAVAATWWSLRESPKEIRKLFRLLPILVTIQVALGAWTVLSQKSPIVTSLHVVTGASILGASLLVALAVSAVASEKRATLPVINAREVTA